jgi:catechol 2,3-dioxygenase-like lactoylglutathione lyase family enzyme
MQKCLRWCLFVLVANAVPQALTGQEETAAPSLQSVAPVLWQRSMNVFRRFAADPSAMYNFYGKALGFKQLSTFDLSAKTQVARFQAGASELKLTAIVPNRQYQHGGVQDATGVRLLTFFFPSPAPLVERFRTCGLSVPEFHSVPGTKTSWALVQDPDRQWVELVADPDAPSETYDRIEIGLTVSNLDASRKFYREFVGLEELPPTEDPVFHVEKYPYRHGTTIISLRCFGKPLPADTGSGGIQYVVSDVKAVESLAKVRQVTIAQPLSTLSAFSLKTIWLDDPDGITNYFAETAVSGQRRPRQ